MPPQTPSDQGYPEQAQWNETSRQPRRDRAPGQPRRNETRIDEMQPPRPRTSRRSVLRGVVGVGAVAAAAAAGAGAVAAAGRQSGQTETLMPVSKPVATAPMAPTAMAGPLVVYIADTTTGLLDVFGGTGATQVNNPALVRQLLANLKLA